ncbi:DUF2470 domain-containing protein [Microbacterium sp. NIBRBAC000506063]|uniref:DUF2470 domain-containing protein n=1 Tax=Microbacterium sp. NIBRBAC000506063 TaxID=2734618 RepID=UPI001BB75237|nr:DUF2470 domain-containing protein [Microbacterium sp. NIBRBAC000506063]QTV80546.1 DUF2470 domain-containing protein [Microbacterium sp. NIBRBAC000506063]
MPHTFDPAIVTAVLHHMNDDHADDNMLIARAFASDAVTAAVMTGFDGDAGVWEITRDDAAEELRVPWPGGPISERPEVRREIVALYDAACERLGLTPRPHA